MNVQLINDDCLNAMKDIPDGSVDMILADPPYGMGFQSNFRLQKYSKIVNDDNLNWVD